MSKCRACNCILNDRELVRKDDNYTRVYYDLCTLCLVESGKTFLLSNGLTIEDLLEDSYCGEDDF
jgi:hypothetical protein|tara:strand:- start:1114 stop:1308 length:195 start_codon:yes stop_codon:yes gene_type:complete